MVRTIIRYMFMDKMLPLSVVLVATLTFIPAVQQTELVEM